MRPRFLHPARLLLVVCAFTVSALLVAAPATAPIPTPDTAAPVIEGSLPNGFRHVLLPHSDAAGGISLRLIVHAGSLDERDDERGYAHFVEHMAFNGTRHYPAGKLVEFFQQLGLDFGRHATASTSYTCTLYRIDLPASQTARLSEALQVLREFADGIRFDPAEVHRERGVMLSELNARDDDDNQAQLRLLAFHHAGTPVATRVPRGDPQQVGRATPERLRAFYDRCYRPGRMTLLAVGDLSADAFATLAATHFASLVGRGADVPQVLPDEPAPAGVRARVVQRTKSRAASVAVTTLARRASDLTTEWHERLAETLVLRIVDRRLDQCRIADRARFGFSAATHSQQIDGAFNYRTLEMHAGVGDWTAAVGALEQVLRRASEDGFTNAEIAEAGAVLEAQLRRSCDEFAAATPRGRGAAVAGELVLHRRWQSPAAALAAAETFLSRFTPADAAETLRRMFPDDRVNLVLTLPAGVAAQEADVLAAWQQSAAEPLVAAASPPSGPGELVFRYTDFGPSGTVAEHRREPEIPLHRVRLSNGVRLSLRPSASEPRLFRLTARIGSGFVDLPHDKPGLAFLALSLFGSADLQRHTLEEFGRLIRLRGISGEIDLSHGDFTESFTGPVAALPFALQCLAAQLSDVKLEPGRLSQALSIYTSQHGATFGATRSYTNAEMVFLAAGADPRLQFPDRGVVARYPFDVVAEWIHAHWLNGPLEIGLAGDFDVDAVIAAAAATVGTLPPRQAPPAIARATGLVLRDTPFRKLTPWTLPDRAATVRVLWPAPAAADPRVQRTLWIAAKALEDRLRQNLREERGVTYSPSVSVSRNTTAPAFAFAVADFTCAPREAAALADRVIRLADTLARAGISPDEFTRAREPLLTGATQAVRQNAWWVEHVLPYAHTHPQVVDDARALVATYTAVSREEVNRIAAQHFRREHASVCGVLPGQPSPPPRDQKQ